MGEIALNGDLLTVVDETSKRTAEDVIKELKRNNLLVTGKQTPFQKVETLLFNYNAFRAAVKEKLEEIEEIKKFGLRQKSISIGSFMAGDGYIDTKSDAEKIEERITQIEDSIQITRNYIRIIDDALDQISDDPYYDLIRLRYFEGCSRDELAVYFSCDPKTVTRNKNRLINLIQIRLFSDHVIKDLFTF